MAGHSQFKNIMHRKGRQDKVRSKLFGKLAREITIAAKLGLPDPAMNPRLRAAIIAARAENMHQGQHRARDQEGAGRRRRELRGDALRGLRPGRRRRHRRGADRQPQPHRRRGARRPSPRAAATSPRPARCRSCSTMSAWSSTTPRRRAPTPCWRPRSTPAPRTWRRARAATRSTPRADSLGDVAKALEAKFGEPRKAALIWKPQNTVAVDDEQGEKVLKLIETLNEHDDVQNVYANFEISDALIARMSA